MVAMPYIENENLFDILIGRIGSYSFAEKEAIILSLYMGQVGLPTKTLRADKDRDLFIGLKTKGGFGYKSEPPF